MAFASLFSCPLNPVHATTMTDSELAGEEREDGELEDGEIDDDGAGIEEEKEAKLDCENETTDKDKEKVQETQSHRHAHKKKIKNKRKMKEKRKLKRKRRDRQKNDFPSSGPDSDSYDSDFDHKHRPKSKKCKGPHEDYDDPIAQEHHRKPPRLAQYKTNDSDENYDYNDEQDDFNEELSKYQQAKKLTTSSQCTAGPKETAVKQRSGGTHGHGHDRGGVGRGNDVINNKKKGKSWGWGRGQGGEPKFRKGTKEEAQCQPGFQKKYPVMSQVFISQHTVEHNGRNVCKYFLEGRCIKGDQCKFDHDNVIPQKKKDLCKFYVQGYCTKGEKCTYMHNEYPCKFFHTGTKCYQGDHCKFSHDPLTELTKQLLDKVLNTEEEHAKENNQDLEDLKNHGIAPLPKPPPGVGLLPTPGPESPQDSSKQIPSLFELKVQPTVDLAQKISLRPNFYNSTSPPSGQFQENGTSVQPSDSSDEMHTRNLMPAGNGHASLPPPASPGTIGGTSIHFPVSSFSQSPPGPAGPQGFGQNTHIPPPVLSSQGSVFHQNVNPQMNQQGANTHSEFFKNLFNIQSLGLLEEGQDMASNNSQHYQEGSTESYSGVQNLPPAIQQALLFHLNQNQQASCPPTTKKNVSLTYRGEETSWYSSCDEDSSSVTAILQTLKKQDDLLKKQHSQAKLQQPGISLSPQADPRLHKERTLSTDSWVKVDPRQRFTEAKKEGSMVSDPRLARDPNTTRTLNTFKMDPKQNVHPNSSVVQKLSTGEEDDEAEREPRDRAVLIPIDRAPGAMLQDPRCQIKKFSHIRVDFLLQRPVFADSVVWAPEDLIPSLIPKQELSINLPLPPLVADAQLKRRRSSCTDSFTSAPASPDPRLVGIHLQEDKRGPGLSARRTQKRCNSEKPSDPRTQKDPSMSRSVSLDSKKTKEKGCNDTVLDPRLQRSQTTNAFKSDSEKLPPYVPHQAAPTAGGLKKPTSLLEGISLYDPLNHSLLSPNNLPKEPLKKAGILKKSIPVAPQTGEDKDLNRDTVSHTSDTQFDQAIHTEVPIHASTTDHVAAPAMHYLPIQPLAGLIRPAYTDPRQNRPSKQAAGVQEDEEVEEEHTVNNKPLRNAFKTFDPMASPFCQ